jgi:hypothetical protein
LGLCLEPDTITALSDLGATFWVARGEQKVNLIILLGYVVYRDLP